MDRSNKNGLLEIFPPEIITNILDCVEPDDCLAAKLTCKSFNAYLQTPFAEVMLSTYPPKITPTYYRNIQDRTVAKLATLQAHVNIENSSDGSKNKGLVCTDCGKVKSCNAFTDSQASVRVVLPAPHSRERGTPRTCIDCQMPDYWRHDFLRKKPIIVGGQELVPCLCCKGFVRREEALHALYKHGKKASYTFCKSCFDSRNSNRESETWAIMGVWAANIQRWAANVGRADEFK